MTCVSLEQRRLRRRPAERQPGDFCRPALLVALGENLFDHHRIIDAYMDPSRFARHRFNRDKKKVAAIYPAY